jgi:hypothetical protein
MFAVLNNILVFISVKQCSFLNEVATQYEKFYNNLLIEKGDYIYSIITDRLNFSG